MNTLSGVYEGRIVTVSDGNATAFVPQVFGDTTITISNFLVAPLPGKGWVAFQSGDSEHPVWLSGAAETVSETFTGDAIFAETVTAPSVVVEADSPTIFLKELAAPVDEKIWKVIPYLGDLYVQAFSDDLLVATSAFWFQRAGVDMTNLVVYGTVESSEVPTAPGHLTNKAYVDSRIWTGTQAAYDAIVTKDPTKLYVVT